MCWISFILGLGAGVLVVPLLGVSLFCLALYLEQKEFIK